MISRILNFLFRRDKGMSNKSISGNDLDFGIYDNRAQVSEWIDIYEGRPKWLSKNINEPLSIGALVASELARLATIEFESNLSGNNIDTLDTWYQTVIKDMRKNMEYLIVQGGLVFKPYVEDGFVYTEVIPGDEFVPLEFDGSGKLKSAVFFYKETVNKKVYTRLEFHVIDNGVYRIFNKVYESRGSNDYDREVSLSSTGIPKWENLSEEVIVENVSKPLFVYMTTPYANNNDIKSPLGISIFSKIGELLRMADKHWSDILREYDYKKVKVFLGSSTIPYDSNMEGDIPLNIDDIQDMFINVHSEETLIDIFSPEIRDTSLFNGLEEIKRMIEFSAGLAYGSLSKVDNVEKTAEEIRSGKERSYNTVRDIQKSMKEALCELVYILKIFGQAEKLISDIDFEVSFHFDDSIVIDEKSDLMLMFEEVKMGLLKPEYYIAKRYGLTLDEAKYRIGGFSDNKEDVDEKATSIEEM